MVCLDLMEQPIITHMWQRFHYYGQLNHHLVPTYDQRPKVFLVVVSSFDQQQVIYVEPSKISIPENCTGTRGIINHPRIMVFENLHAQRSHTLCRPLCLLTIAWCMSFAYHHIFCMQTMSQNDGFLVSWTLSKENAVSRFQNNNGLSFRSDSMYVC